MQNVSSRQSLGGIVHQAVNEFFPDIIDVEFTAQMEKGLDDVEEGKIKVGRGHR